MGTDAAAVDSLHDPLFGNLAPERGQIEPRTPHPLIYRSQIPLTATQLASIPVLAIACVHVEADLKALSARLYGRLGGQASLRELNAAIGALRVRMISSIAILFVALNAIRESGMVYLSLL